MLPKGSTWFLLCVDSHGVTLHAWCGTVRLLACLAGTVLLLVYLAGTVWLQVYLADAVRLFPCQKCLFGCWCAWHDGGLLVI